MTKVKATLKTAEIFSGINLISAIYNNTKVIVPGKANDAFTRTMINLKRVVKSVDEDKNTILDLHVKKARSGEPETKDQGDGTLKYVFKNTESETAYKKAYKELMDKKHEVVIVTPKYEDLKDLSISPDLISELVILGLLEFEESA